jgi:quercetin dioxygenase-like cupin family protein
MKRIFLLTAVVLIAAPSADAKTKAAKPKAPAELKWMDGPPGLPAGATFAVKKGNPEAKGAFTIGIRMPPGYSVPPHWHPSDEHVTLVSGKLAYGMSDRMSRTAATGLATGQSVVMKAKEHHWVMSADGAEVEVSAVGPFKIAYVNPADDPRGTAKPK